MCGLIELHTALMPVFTVSQGVSARPASIVAALSISAKRALTVVSMPSVAVSTPFPIADHMPKYARPASSFSATVLTVSKDETALLLITSKATDALRPRLAKKSPVLISPDHTF